MPKELQGTWCNPEVNVSKSEIVNAWLYRPSPCPSPEWITVRIDAAQVSIEDITCELRKIDKTTCLPPNGGRYTASDSDAAGATWNRTYSRLSCECEMAASWRLIYGDLELVDHRSRPRPAVAQFKPNHWGGARLRPPTSASGKRK